MNLKDLPKVGLGGELAYDMVQDSRRDMAGWRGVIPVEACSAEQVQTLAEGPCALLTFDTAEGPVQLAVPVQMAAGLGARLSDITRGASRLVIAKEHP